MFVCLFVCCLLACTDYLGVENGDIPDANFNASRGFPFRARLNGPTVWWVNGTTSSPWIQVDIGYSTNITGLLTQSMKYKQDTWITKLKVSTFTTTSDQEVFISDGNGKEKVNITDHLLRFKNQIRNHSHFLMCDHC